MQGLVDTSVKKPENSPAVSEADLHFGGMDVDVHVLRRHGQVQDSKGKAVLHEVCPIAFFKPCGELFAAQHAAVDKEGLKAPAGSADLGSAQKSIQLHAGFGIFRMDRDDGAGGLAAVDTVDQLLQVSVAGRVELVLAVDAVMEGYAGVRQGLFLNQVRDITGFRLRLAQEPAADGDGAEEVADDDGGAVRRPDLRQIDLYGGVRRVGCQVVIDRPCPGDRAAHLGDHLHLRDGGDAGQGLAAKTQGGQA